MLYSLGGFKFESAIVLGQIQKTTDYAISEQERINNYPAYFSVKNEKETLTIKRRYSAKCRS
ncbi:MAG: hypothetical protein LBF71_05085 [Campylobacteraceae bacterium]|jgi:phage protein U|nr:hypothetical protein [Campylobacteraceae bacterium]